MPHLPDHRNHDLLLIAALAAGDAEGTDLERARDLVAACDDCAALHHDLRTISAALPATPAPTRSRDFRLTPEQADSLRPAGWRRLLAPLAGPRFAFAAPLGGSLAALGIAGILVAGAACAPHPRARHVRRERAGRAAASQRRRRVRDRAERPVGGGVLGARSDPHAGRGVAGSRGGSARDPGRGTCPRASPTPTLGPPRCATEMSPAARSRGSRPAPPARPTPRRSRPRRHRSAWARRRGWSSRACCWWSGLVLVALRVAARSIAPLTRRIRNRPGSRPSGQGHAAPARPPHPRPGADRRATPRATRGPDLAAATSSPRATTAPTCTATCGRSRPPCRAPPRLRVARLPDHPRAGGLAAALRLARRARRLRLAPLHARRAPGHGARRRRARGPAAREPGRIALPASSGAPSNGAARRRPGAGRANPAVARRPERRRLGRGLPACRCAPAPSAAASRARRHSPRRTVCGDSRVPVDLVPRHPPPRATPGASRSTAHGTRRTHPMRRSPRRRTTPRSPSSAPD